MKLRDIVVEKAIIAPLKSTKRDDAIRELVEVLATQGAVKPALIDELSKAVIKREKRGSTGFGHGVAAPHVKTTEVQRVFVAVGIAPGGLEFQALDNLSLLDNRRVFDLLLQVGEVFLELCFLDFEFVPLEDQFEAVQFCLRDALLERLASLHRTIELRLRGVT